MYLTLEHITKEFRDVRAVDHVSLMIQEGESFSLLGPSGCGKTTLLRMIAGFIQPSSGDIRIQNRSIVTTPPHRRDVGIMFQNYALFPHMTVGANVAFGLKMRRLPGAVITRKVAEMLQLVQLADLGHRFPAQLSGGQQQRVALARALATEPKVLLLDEPLSALDKKLREEMQVELRNIQRRLGITMVFVTHDQEEALTLSDRIAVMNGGRLIQVGAPDQIYRRPVNQFVAGFIGKANLLCGRLEVEPEPRFILPTGVQHPVSPELDGRSGLRQAIVRPENIKLTLAHAGSQERLIGTVQSVIYLGTVFHVFVSIPDTEPVVAYLSPTEVAALGDGLRPGTSVVVDWDPEHLVFLEPME